MQMENNAQELTGIKKYFKEQNIELSFNRIAIQGLGGMAHGLFASLLIGTITVSYTHLAENNLSICAEFRRHDIDIFLAVHSVGAAFCERLGQECADDLGPIHTDDRIDGLFIREASSQRFRGFTRHGEIMLHRSDIDIIVDV